MKIQKLPIDSDLSISSFWWAVQILGETPLRLCVSQVDAHDAVIRFSDIEIRTDPGLDEFAWRIEGPNGCVYSEGA
jgi:hypothetical protein